LFCLVKNSQSCTIINSSQNTRITDSQDFIVPANEFAKATDPYDFHMRFNGQCARNGVNLILGGYSYFPNRDCDRTFRVTTENWDIGIDFPYDSVFLIDPVLPESTSSISFGSNILSKLDRTTNNLIALNQRLLDRFDNKDYYKRKES